MSMAYQPFFFTFHSSLLQLNRIIVEKCMDMMKTIMLVLSNIIQC